MKNETTLTQKELVNVIPTSAITSMAWWAKLNADEQGEVLSESQKLGTALVQHGVSRMAIGEHLARLQSVLEPHNLFQRFLKNFHFSKRTAYRYIAGFNNAKQRLPAPIITAAMARGVNIVGESELKPLGIYTAAVAKLPPPQNPTPAQAVTWLEQVEAVRKQTKSEEGTASLSAVVVPQDPQTLMRECFKFVSVRYKRLPSNSKTRANWVRSLVGMVLTELGVGGPQTYSPVAIPEEFQIGRGRPRVVQQATA